MKRYTLSAAPGGENLLSLLQKNGIYLPAPCGGNGTCGKCRVRILSEDSEELVLSCKTVVKGKVTVEIGDSQSEDQICAGKGFIKAYAPPEGSQYIKKQAPESSAATMEALPLSVSDSALRAVIDLGTTTLAGVLIDTRSGNILSSAAGINHQRIFGADIISRIDAAVRGNGARLKELAEADIAQILHELTPAQRRLSAEADFISAKPLPPVIISGNTTMQHLLQGLSLETLGKAPYKPIDISLHEREGRLYLPGISAFVGADIVSGIISCGMDKREDISILLDLGTNGEMAIGNKDRILVSSTSAGPAFEGGKIEYGTASVCGAIKAVRIHGNRPVVSTIGGAAAIGICGTGIIEMVYELLKTGLLDETGLLLDPYFEKGFPLTASISFSEADVREVQLAKAAISAGLIILMKEYGISEDEVSHLFLSGGFGEKLNIKKAAGIGLIPPALINISEPVGNSSLSGACLFATDKTAEARFRRVSETAAEIRLSEHPSFNDLYMENLNFPKLQ